MASEREDAIERARAWLLTAEREWCPEHPKVICDRDLAAFAQAECARALDEAADAQRIPSIILSVAWQEQAAEATRRVVNDLRARAAALRGGA